MRRFRAKPYKDIEKLKSTLIFLATKKSKLRRAPCLEMTRRNGKKTKQHSAWHAQQKVCQHQNAWCWNPLNFFVSHIVWYCLYVFVRARVICHWHIAHCLRLLRLSWALVLMQEICPIQIKFTPSRPKKAMCIHAYAPWKRRGWSRSKASLPI